MVAHHVLELLRAQLAVFVAQGPVLREAHEVRGGHVDAGVEVLGQVNVSGCWQPTPTLTQPLAHIHTN